MFKVFSIIEEVIKFKQKFESTVNSNKCSGFPNINCDISYVVTVKCTDTYVGYRFQAKMTFLDYEKLDQIICGLKKMA